jgi:hypothetical protein
MDILKRHADAPNPFSCGPATGIHQYVSCQWVHLHFGGYLFAEPVEGLRHYVSLIDKVSVPALRLSIETGRYNRDLSYRYTD